VGSTPLKTPTAINLHSTCAEVRTLASEILVYKVREKCSEREICAISLSLSLSLSLLFLPWVFLYPE
jgi:hypothetical protein